MRTIGVAIAVPEPFGEQLRAKRLSYGDVMAETVPSHVTLVPPTEVDDAQLGRLVEALTQVAAIIPSFRMTLKGTGTFRPVSPVVFVAVSEGISVTELLAQAIRHAVDLPEPQFPFHPHVTVAHHLDDEALDRAFDDLSDFRCSFEVSQFSLYFHDEVQGWMPERSFRLS
ncbi:2'-5' RNA ligase family protein [Aeromicrobium camelliae]|uniref:2'-5' RNA ligase family protein n=1 Tax=Aeromicrobium camelliae TaxID=1538144 RepID=A0A3N6X2H2_9ACTN|nr:2'-5' RNA ligase family protein [Aeromicrobium camelliae]RQN08315.1 2'-5' RNA ligase family protein [Aeromicrobium camelliae]